MTQTKPQPAVLQVIPDLESGGAEKTVLDIGDALVAAGWRSFAASAGGRLVKPLENGGTTHITLPLRTKNPLALWRNAGRIARVVRQHNIDIIHARSRGPAWSAWLAARRTGARFVTTYHGAYTQKYAFKAAYNGIMAKADTIIANSEWTARLVNQRRPDAKTRIVTIPRGTDFEQFKRDAIDPHRVAYLSEQWQLKTRKAALASEGDDIPTALLLGRLTRLKGHTPLIEAAAQLKAQGKPMIFILAGDATGREDYADALKAMIVEKNVEDRVFLVGHCDDPAAALALCDVLVSASTQAETFGRTVVEAAALERAVIATDIGAVVESIKPMPAEDATGWLVASANATALANALSGFASLSPKQRHAMGQRGRAFVVDRFSLHQMCHKTLAVYRNLIDRSAGPAV